MKQIVKLVNSSLIVIAISMSVSGGDSLPMRTLIYFHKQNELQLDSMRTQNNIKLRMLEEKMKNYELVPKNKK